LVPHVATVRPHDESQAVTLLQELLATHDRFPTLFDEHRSRMVLFDRLGNLVRANRATLAFLGVRSDDLNGRRYGALIARSALDAARSAFERAAAGETVDVAAKIIISSGETVDIPMTLVPAVVDRTIVGVYGSVQSGSEGPTRKLQELTSLFTNTADAVIVFDATGLCVDANAASESITGQPASELRGRDYLSLLAPAVHVAARDVFARVMRGVSVSTDTVFLGRDERRIDVSGTSVPIVVDGKVVGAYTIARDISADRRLEAALREQTERMRELYLLSASTEQSAQEQILTALALGCKRLHCDAGFVGSTHGEDVVYLYGIGEGPRVTGSKEPFAGSLHSFLLDQGAAAAFEGSEFAGVAGFAGTPIDINGQRTGTLCLVRARAGAQPFDEADRDFVGLIGMLASSILERDEQRHRTETLAFYDHLTGLPNRTLLRDRMEHAIATAARHAEVFALHFYDLDNFKQINDEHGHLRGDDVLRALARRFERIARHEDTVARIGGDEFVVLQPGIHSRDDIEKLARRLQAAASEPLELGGSIYRLTISGGIALFPEDGDDADALLHRADSAMYRVKQRGRNDVSFFNPPS
jgi:diguanylate cyclase (GGDEF)-like protein/PAS domain S-box-containing protein